MIDALRAELEKLQVRNQELVNRVRYLRTEVLSSKGRQRLAKALAAGDEKLIAKLRAESENAETEIDEIQRAMRILSGQIGTLKAQIADVELPGSLEEVNALVAEYQEAADAAIAAGRKLQRAYLAHRDIAKAATTYQYRAGPVPPLDCNTPTGVAARVWETVVNYS